MWYSIESIVTPKTLAEAYSLQQREGTTLFSGGSYLVAEKPPSIRVLIDINNLLDNTVTAEPEAVHIQAGATLQTFIDSVKVINPNCRLLEGARASCPSKQIRNQRTFGGEVGQNRPNSEALVFLHAVDAELTVYPPTQKTQDENLGINAKRVITSKSTKRTKTKMLRRGVAEAQRERGCDTVGSHTDSASTISIREWDGKGIVTRITYYPNQIDRIELQRFSVLQSAPAIVIVGGSRRNGQFEIAIGGTANIIQTFNVPADDWTDNSIAHIAKEAVSQFIPDHFGSLNYKESLIATALKRVGAAL